MTPREQARAALEAAAEIYAEHGDGPDFASLADGFYDLPHGDRDLHDALAGCLREGDSAESAVDHVIAHHYDEDVIEEGFCHPDDLEHYRDWFESAYGHDGSEEQAPEDGPFLDAYELEEAT